MLLSELFTFVSIHDQLQRKSCSSQEGTVKWFIREMGKLHWPLWLWKLSEGCVCSLTGKGQHMDRTLWALASVVWHKHRATTRQAPDQTRRIGILSSLCHCLSTFFPTSERQRSSKGDDILSWGGIRGGRYAAYCEALTRLARKSREVI